MGVNNSSRETEDLASNREEILIMELDKERLKKKVCTVPSELIDLMSNVEGLDAEITRRMQVDWRHWERDLNVVLSKRK